MAKKNCLVNSPQTLISDRGLVVLSCFSFCCIPPLFYSIHYTFLSFCYGFSFIAYFVYCCFFHNALLPVFVFPWFETTCFLSQFDCSQAVSRPKGDKQRKGNRKKNLIQRAVCLSRRVTESVSFCPFHPIVSIETS